MTTVYEGAVRGENRSSLARLRRHIPEPHTVLCVHRRLVFQQHYFLNPWCLRTFGRPNAVRANLETVTVKRFYELVWNIVKRYVPDWDPELHAKMISSEKSNHGNTKEEEGEKVSDEDIENNTLDPNTPPHPGTMNRWVYRGKDGILPYDGVEFEEMLLKYPFRLSLVKKDGSACSVCNVLQACTGCLLPPLDVLMDDVVSGEQACVSIDWSPKAIREFYNQKRAALTHTHDSVKESLASQKKPCLLTKCLEEFSKVNEITKYCSTCTKKNGGDFTETKHTYSDEVWAVPPYLMFQIKRFKAYGQHSYKLGNLVEFPLKDFDFHPFLAKEMHTLTGDALKKIQKESNENTISRCKKRLKKTLERREAKKVKLKSGSRDLTKFEEETEDIAKNEEITEDMLKCLPKSLARDDTVYDLYGVCHQAGTLRGGHYYADAVDNEGKWWRFDDKNVKPLSDTSKLISPSAYILFYARKDVQKIDLTKIYPTYFKEKRNEKEILSAKWKKPKHKDGSGNEGGLRRNCIVM